MEYKEDMCCLCLKESESSVNLYSKNGTNPSYFNKITSSLTKLGELLFELKGCDYNVCQSCGSLIGIVYQFNTQCMSSVAKLKEFLKIKRQQQLCDDSETSKSKEPSDISNATSVTIELKKEPEDLPSEMDIELNANVDIKQECLAEVDKVETPDKNATFHFVHFLENANENTVTEAGVQENKEEISKKNPTVITKRRHKPQLILPKNKKEDFYRKTRTCKYCNKTFKKTSYLTEHMRIHTNYRPYKCKVCGNGFRRIQHLRLHFTLHSGVKAFKCSICECAFRQKGILMAHMLKHEGMTKEIVEKMIERDSLKIKEITELPLEMIKVEENADPEEPNLSEIEIKPINKQQTCEFCNKFFKRPSDLVEHRRSHTDERPYKCNKCGKAFRRSSHLEIHLRIHSGVKAFKCDICDCSFTQKSNLTTHMLKHDENAVKPVFICEICGQNFTQKVSLLNHSTIHTGKRDYTCEICGRQFREERNYLRHKLTHSEDRQLYKCNYCDKTYKNETTVNNHMQAAHIKENSYECKVCQKSFHLKSYLTIHMKRHAADRPYVCSVCNKSFLTKYQLDTHFVVHTGEKPFICNLCDKAFAFSKNLECHMRTHTGDKLKCQYCSKEYASIQGLRKHEKTHKSE